MILFLNSLPQSALYRIRYSTDRGVHYTSNRYKKLTVGLICSYSGKGNTWDNACIESYHALIKREWLNRFKIIDYNHAYNLIFEYLEGFYNTVRIHSHCNYLSLNVCESNYKTVS